MKKFIDRVGAIIRLVVPWILGITLLGVWIGSERHDGKPYFENIFILFVLLGIIFFADALEVAYSLLRYKHPEQFGGAEARILKEMHDDENLVYETREWLVTILIVAITLMAEFDHGIYLPISGKEIGPNFYVPGLFTIQARTLFSLLFTTLPVLWFAQGLSKRIARDCPQKIFGAGALVWELIKKIAWFTNALGLNDPTEWLTKQLKKSEIFSDELNLKPSDHAFFIASVQRYGYALHDLSIKIVVEQSGACKVTVRVLYYVISKPCNVFGRRLSFDKALPLPQNHFVPKPVEVYRGPVIQEADPSGKNNDVLRKELDYICSRGAEGSITSKPLFSMIPANVTIVAIADPQPSLMHYRIDTHGSIPDERDTEEEADDRALYNYKNKGAVAILAEFTSSWGPGAFDVTPLNQDFYYMNFECPCYRYRLTVETEPNCSIQFCEINPEAFCARDPHWGERDRLQRSLRIEEASPKAIHCELYYPFPGIRYQLQWKNE